MSTADQIWMGSIAFGAFVLMAVLLIAKWRRPHVRYALRGLSSGEIAQSARAKHSPVGDALAYVARIPIPEAFTARLGQLHTQRRLLAAGEPYQLSAAGFIRIKLAIQAFILVVFLALTLTAILTQGLVVVFVVFYGVCALALWILPDVWLKEKVKGRTAAVDHAVPDLIDLLAASVDGGIALEKALRSISARFPDPLGAELRHTISDIDKSAKLDVALREMAERTGADELRRFIRPYMQALEQGGRTTAHLREIAYDMRERRKLKAIEGGEKAEKKMLMPMMLCMLPTVLIVELGPALVSFLGSIQGK